MALSTKLLQCQPNTGATVNLYDSSSSEEDFAGLLEAFKPDFEVYSSEIMRIGPVAKNKRLLGNVDAAHGEEEAIRTLIDQVYDDSILMHLVQRKLPPISLSSTAVSSAKIGSTALSKRPSTNYKA